MRDSLGESIWMASNLEILGWVYRNSRIQSHGRHMHMCSQGVYILGTKDCREIIPHISLCEMLSFFQFSVTGRNAFSLQSFPLSSLHPFHQPICFPALKLLSLRSEELFFFYLTRNIGLFVPDKEEGRRGWSVSLFSSHAFWTFIPFPPESTDESSRALANLENRASNSSLQPLPSFISCFCFCFF